LDREGTVIHSDQGVQFGSWAFTKRAPDSGLLASMGSIGDCYDNSMIEAFWSRMQVELLDRKKWNTRLELANAIFEYLEIWHNRKRRHSQLGWLTPVEFERNRIITVACESKESRLRGSRDTPEPGFPLPAWRDPLRGRFSDGGRDAQEVRSGLP
jgi:hypothetical protein